MWAHFEPTLQQRLDQLKSKASLAERVRACLLERLPAGGANMAQVAARLLMSQRSLQRRPSDEDQSFQGILRQVRMELAAHYLDNMELSVAQIAYLLGFEDPSSFSRAYREWTGLSPDQARVAAA
ncbi:MAG: helix-turn-helix transcriptional regulator [Hylemonella sp.]|nr:helix-turn-helix transcriptional regulator [Hylemonella sp.]